MPDPAGALRFVRRALALGLACAAALAPASVSAQAFGRNKIQYAGFDWHVLQTEHFDVYYYPEAEALARIGAAEAEAQYGVLSNRFATSLGERVPIVFYATNLHFKETNITPGFIPDGVGGFFEFLKGRVVIPADGNLGRFRRVIRHELVHVFTFNRLARVLRDHRSPGETQLPLWFTEGLAEYWSGPPDHQHEMILRDAVASNSFVPLHDLDRIAGTFTMYKEGEAFCRFVSTTYGEERLLELIDEVWRDASFNRVLTYVLGQPVDEVSDRWEAFVRAEYAPRLAGADVPSLTAEAIAGRGFSAKPVVWTRPDGTREVLFYGNRGSYSSIYAQPVDAEMRPSGDVRTVIRGEQSADYEAFHLFESRLDVSASGVLAFVTKRGGADVVHLYDLAADRRIAVLGFDRLVAIYSPTLSDDAQTVVFSAIDAGGIANLYLYSRTAGTLRQLTHDDYDDRDPDLSADGQTVAFSSDRSSWGASGHYNLFALNVASGSITALTDGPQMDLSPRWSPDGRRLAFASARRDSAGVFGAQDVWIADLVDTRPPARAAAGTARPAGGPAASADAPLAEMLDSGASEVSLAPGRGTFRQLTRFTSAAFDPVWADSSHLVVATFEDYRFTVRTLDADSLLATPESITGSGVPAASAAEPWHHPTVASAEGVRGAPYRRRYTLDVAAGGFTTTSTASYTAGGATLAFSDQLGNDRIFVTAYSANTSASGRSLVDGLNVSVTRVHLGRRAHVGYGAFRLAGPRYDRTDPQGTSRIPSFEQQVGVLGVVSYPISFFRRIDLETTFGVGSREGLRREFGQTEFDTLRTALLSNTVAFVHDNALYGGFGPVEGWRGTAAVGYTTDVAFSNESYVALTADVRRYWRITPSVTLATWGLARMNLGRRARLNLLGGSWSLRGFPLLRVRGSKLWFTSNELRFPLLPRPPLFPLIAGLRGAVFLDAAHNWTDGYSDATLDPDFSDPEFPLRIG
ncbi:MAG TPA: BamA/TamA family outer membrane protein, partial [Rubricoccaceae bacterium]